MTVLEATRKWVRENCPCIDKQNRFNAGYLGAEATAYSITKAGDSHKQDITGKDMETVNLVFAARMPFGEAARLGILAAEFFEGLSYWLLEQERAHSYPSVSGYTVTQLTATNAGLLTQADAQTAQYQMQIKLILEED